MRVLLDPHVGQRLRAVVDHRDGNLVDTVCDQLASGRLGHRDIPTLPKSSGSDDGLDEPPSLGASGVVDDRPLFAMHVVNEDHGGGPRGPGGKERDAVLGVDDDVDGPKSATAEEATGP